MQRLRSELETYGHPAPRGSYYAIGRGHLRYMSIRRRSGSCAWLSGRGRMVPSFTALGIVLGKHYEQAMQEHGSAAVASGRRGEAGGGGGGGQPAIGGGERARGGGGDTPGYLEGFIRGGGGDWGGGGGGGEGGGKIAPWLWKRPSSRETSTMNERSWARDSGKCEIAEQEFPRPLRNMNGQRCQAQ